jgi:hypothetical protein
MGKALRVALLLIIAGGVGAALHRYGRIPQPEAYHHFADVRTYRGIPNAWNVLSNIPFLLVGWLGLAFLRRGPTLNPDGPFRPGAHTAFESLRERPAYVLFFAGVFFTAFGSAYYHLAPSTNRLFWDRLPMAVAFTALFAAVIAERISIYWSRMLLIPLVFAGIGSVVAWRLSEQSGASDLRAYLFVQIFPLLAFPLMIALFRARYSRGLELLVVAGVYGVAKVFEQFDVKVWELTGGQVSGHSIKHVVAAIASFLVLDMLRKRGRAQLSINEMLAPSGNFDLPPPSSRR